MTSQNILALCAAFMILVPSVSAAAARDDDGRIESAAKHSYVFRTYLKDDRIGVQSKDGVVTLKGKVPSRNHKELAQETVENLPGVKSVDNQLTVSGEPAREHSDEWIEFKVRWALLFHRSVSGTKTKVSAKEGVVTLEGVAANQAQKDLTAEYAKDVEGVQNVKNLMTVSPPTESANADRTVGEVIDDASITVQVKSALLTHRSTSALRTKVKTVNGVVVITGEAKNEAEKALVTKLANDIHGVKSVVNQMDIRG